MRKVISDPVYKMFEVSHINISSESYSGFKMIHHTLSLRPIYSVSPLVSPSMHFFCLSLGLSIHTFLLSLPWSLHPYIHFFCLSLGLSIHTMHYFCLSLGLDWTVESRRWRVDGGEWTMESGRWMEDLS